VVGSVFHDSTAGVNSSSQEFTTKTQRNKEHEEKKEYENRVVRMQFNHTISVILQILFSLINIGKTISGQSTLLAIMRMLPMLNSGYKSV
jgi:hypothetical protein